MQHAIFSASSSPKWLNCPASIYLENKIIDMDTFVAIEGTIAHKLAETKLRLLFKDTMIKPISILNDLEYEIQTNNINKVEIHKHTNNYVKFIKSICNKNKAYKRHIEYKCDYDMYATGGFGTADCILLYKNTIHVIDFKYGIGKTVSAHNNTQLMLYALGYLANYKGNSNISNIKLTIYQPRKNNISEYTLNINDLLAFGEVVKHKSKLAFSINNRAIAGDYCNDNFCKGKPICNAYSDQFLKLPPFNNKHIDKIDNKYIAELYATSKQAYNWHKSLQEYILNNYNDIQNIDIININKHSFDLSKTDEIVKVCLANKINPYRLKTITDIKGIINDNDKFNSLFNELLIEKTTQRININKGDF